MSDYSCSISSNRSKQSQSKNIRQNYLAQKKLWLPSVRFLQAFQRNLIAHERITTRLKRLTGKRSSELLINHNCSTISISNLLNVLPVQFAKGATVPLTMPTKTRKVRANANTSKRASAPPPPALAPAPVLAPAREPTHPNLLVVGQKLQGWQRQTKKKRPMVQKLRMNPSTTAKCMDCVYQCSGDCYESAKKKDQVTESDWKQIKDTDNGSVIDAEFVNVLLNELIPLNNEVA